MTTKIQRICVKAKPLESNPDYYDWQTASIAMFIQENNKAIAIKKASNELKRRHWQFISYEDKSTLIEERVREAGGEVWEAYQDALKSTIFFRVFPDHFGAGRNGIKPIRPARIKEPFIDEVIKNAGGRRLSEAVKKPGVRNADYILGDFIFELKDIQEEVFLKGSHQQKLAELFNPYFPGKSEIIIDPSILSKPDFLKYLDIISKPIKTHIKTASKQVKDTRLLLGKPDIKGGVIILNTGFGSCPHDEFANQVERYALKDSRQFEAIVTISTWFYTNGFDSYMFYKFSPSEPQYSELECIRKSFDASFGEMMTQLVRGELPDSTEYSAPLSPISFVSEGIDFNWSPPTIPLPWDR
jgi:hypothetical protein